MQNSVALVDLQDYSPSLQQLSTWLEQHDILYLFHTAHQSPFHLHELTELSTWISSGQVVILDLPQETPLEYQYAMLVGQLMAMIEPSQQIVLLSAMPSAQQLLQLLQASALNCQWQTLLSSTEIATETPAELSWGQRAWQALDILLQPVQRHRLYMNYVPLAVQQRLQQARQLQQSTMLLQVEPAANSTNPIAPIEAIPSSSPQDLDKKIAGILQEAIATANLDTDDSSLHFHASDQVHFELLRQLQQKQVAMPKDIYVLKDLLTEIFPDADASLIIKALIKRGYIYWNGHEVTYSYEMYLN